MTASVPAPPSSRRTPASSTAGRCGRGAAMPSLPPSWTGRESETWWASMRWESVLAWRMARHHLVRRSDDPLGVISDICGLHAQVMSSAQLTLWARANDPPAVEELLWRDRVLVKTWAMRGTLHLLRTDELPLYVGAQAALKPRYEQSTWLRPFQVTADEYAAILKDVPEALAEGPRSRDGLAAIHPQLGRGYGDLLKPL